MTVSPTRISIPLDVRDTESTAPEDFKDYFLELVERFGDESEEPYLTIGDAASRLANETGLAPEFFYKARVEGGVVNETGALSNSAPGGDAISAIDSIGMMMSKKQLVVSGTKPQRT